jgi:hypothetical protein
MDNSLAPFPSHYATSTRSGHHLLATYNVQAQLRAVADRLRESSASYNRLIEHEALHEQAAALCAVICLMSISDNTKLADAEGQQRQITIECIESLVAGLVCT